MNRGEIVISIFQVAWFIVAFVLIVAFWPFSALVYVIGGMILVVVALIFPQRNMGDSFMVIVFWPFIAPAALLGVTLGRLFFDNA